VQDRDGIANRLGHTPIQLDSLGPQMQINVKRTAPLPLQPDRC
jgi:hypothetical protein